MLSKVLKERIEEKFGQQVRYGKDCEALAEHIFKTCKSRLSASTIERLFGFSKDTKQPRLYTLDIISKYLGFDRWEELLHSLNKNDALGTKEIEHLKTSQVSEGDIIHIGYQPTVKLTVKALGGNSFEVVNVEAGDLRIGDVIRFSEITLHYPLFVEELVRDGRKLGQLQLGKVSGVTSITIESKVVE